MPRDGPERSAGPAGDAAAPSHPESASGSLGALPPIRVLAVPGPAEDRVLLPLLPLLWLKPLSPPGQLSLTLPSLPGPAGHGRIWECRPVTL